MNELVKEIIDREYPMFISVNGEDRVSCQNDKQTFYGMREGQFSQWSEAALACYLQDLKDAEAAGRNLLREKYARMMKSTSPAEYEQIAPFLPEISEEAEALVTEIWELLLPQTEVMREKYPLTGMAGRPLRASEETTGWASVETYQRGELYTYSVATLKALLAHIKALSAAGESYAMKVQAASLATYGFKSIDEAEAYARKQAGL